MTKLLIVDDNEQNRYLLGALFKGHGYEVCMAPDGNEALKAARESPPDLVITDILMPGMDGYSLCRAWKSDEALKNVPLVFYTATYTDQKDEDLAMNLGAARFIVKPAEPEALLLMLREVMEERDRNPQHLPAEPVLEEKVYLKKYNEALIRKLEDKIMDLESANMRLEKEVTERRRAEMTIKASLKEKEILLREIHHRVKGNLQSIASLLSLQAEKFKEPPVKEAFNQIRIRIRSIALVHEKLYNAEDFSHIDFGDYIQSIIDELVLSYGSDDTHVELKADRISLNIEKALPLALIINELLSNALIHAFPERGRGAVHISLLNKGQGKISFVIRDEGKGLPESINLDDSATLGLGLTLVRALVEQIEGTIKIRRDTGTAFRILFSKEGSLTL